VSVSTAGDLLDTDGGDAQVVLAADIWYERRLSARALSLLRRATARGATVLVGDVGRAFLPREHMRDLAAYDIPVVADLENAAVKRTQILTLRLDCRLGSAIERSRRHRCMTIQPHPRPALCRQRRRADDH